MKGLIWFLMRSSLPSPFSMTEGKERRRRVCPVGAVSNTTTEKFIPFTSLKIKQTNSTDILLTHAHLNNQMMLEYRYN